MRLFAEPELLAQCAVLLPRSQPMSPRSLEAGSTQQDASSR